MKFLRSHLFTYGVSSIFVMPYIVYEWCSWFGHQGTIIDLFFAVILTIANIGVLWEWCRASAPLRKF